MSPFNILIIFLSLSISLWEGDAQNVQGFRLALTWPPALCANDNSKCNGIVRNFTIHGLWPFDSNGASLINCQGSNFNPANLVTFRSGLDRAWPNFGTGGNDAVWRYQWNKHGKCSEGLLAQGDYFRNAMSTLWSLDVVKILDAKGIKPDDRDYKVQDILNAFSRAVRVNCKPDGSGHVLLYEIFLCLTSRGAPTNCGGSGEANCGGVNAYIKFKS